MGQWSRMFPGDKTRVREARWFARGVLAGHALAGLAELVVSELATNAVLHSNTGRYNGPFVVEIDSEHDRVFIVVTDLGNERSLHPRANRAALASLAENGRGLAIVDALAKEWGTDDVSCGLSVWAELVDESAS